MKQLIATLALILALNVTFAQTDGGPGKGKKVYVGAAHQLVAKLVDKNGDIIWESNAYKASPNGTNGFNSGDAVVKKLMRDLKKKFKD